MRIMLVGGIAAGLFAAGCGGTTCEDAIGNAAKVYGFGGASYASVRAQGIQKCKEEHWPEKMRACAVSAKTRSDLDGCEKHKHESRGGGDVEEYGRKARRSEAELNLEAIKKSMKVYYAERAEFPKGSAPLTPSTSCCEGPNHKCAPNNSDWNGVEVWDTLDFEILDPGYFRYSYESDGTTATAKAVGDLDCDETTVEYVLEARQDNGSPVFTLTKPARPD